jgi:hypothetical protein
MLVKVAKVAARLGCAPTESAVRASLAAPDDEASHDAFMAQYNPRVRAALRASLPAEVNRKGREASEYDKRAREDPMAIPGTPKVVTISPASATYSTTDLPGFGKSARAPGRPMFGHN